MFRVLFDKNVPYPLKRHLTAYEVNTAEEEGWGQISNGEPIRWCREGRLSNPADLRSVSAEPHPQADADDRSGLQHLARHKAEDRRDHRSAGKGFAGIFRVRRDRSASEAAPTATAAALIRLRPPSQDFVCFRTGLFETQRSPTVGPATVGPVRATASLAPAISLWAYRSRHWRTKSTTALERSSSRSITIRGFGTRTPVVFANLRKVDAPRVLRNKPLLDPHYSFPPVPGTSSRCHSRSYFVRDSRISLRS
jgi:hypothetical protein